MGYQDLFLAPLPGSIALFTSLLEVILLAAIFCTMRKKGDPKVPILPSTTRKGMVLSTSATLDSPSVMSKFASPPSHAPSTDSVTMPDTFDDASTTIDEPGLIGYFIQTQIAKAPKQSGIELPITRYPHW